MKCKSEQKFSNVDKISKTKRAKNLYVNNKDT